MLIFPISKYNVFLGKGERVHIGDRVFMGWNDEAIDALIKQYKYLNLTEACRDRDALNIWLESLLKRLKQQSFSDIRQDFVLRSRRFNYIGKMSEFELPVIPNFELPFGVFNKRGEAFFMLSEFDSIDTKGLEQFASQCFDWAREQVNVSDSLQALYNGREPAHICFAIAIVDKLDEETCTTVRTTNPFNKRADPLWYQVPVVYELERNQLHCYEQSANLFEHIIGIGIWDSLRKVLQQYLMPSSQ